MILYPFSSIGFASVSASSAACFIVDPSNFLPIKNASTWAPRHGIGATPPSTSRADCTVLSADNCTDAATADIAKSSDALSLNFRYVDVLPCGGGTCTCVTI